MAETRVSNQNLAFAKLFNSFFNSIFDEFILICRLETCPPTSTQPKAAMEGWHRATLTVPTTIKTIDENGKEVPIPPPRRKRTSQEGQHIEKPKSGFKELFGQNISRRSSCDSAMHIERAAAADKEKFEAQQRRTQSAANLMPAETLAKLHIEPRPVVTIPQPLVSSSSSTPSPDRPVLQRKVSRVGNKKSDKFFGENLSDCLSDEPIENEPVEEPIHQVSVDPATASAVEMLGTTKDDIDIFIEQNITQRSVEDIVKSTTIEPRTISINDEIVITDNEPTNEAPSKLADMDGMVHEKRDSLDKKAEFLMAMLDDDKLYKTPSNDNASTTTDETVVAAPRRKHSKQQEAEVLRADAVEKQMVKDSRAAGPQLEPAVDEADYYKGRAPVEEPIIVPKRRHYGHICDKDHDHSVHQHEAVHGHDEPDARPPVSIETQIIPVAEVASIVAPVQASAPIACPKKPKRDFALYEKSKQSTSSGSSSPEEPKPVKRMLRKKQRPSSVENLLSTDLDSSPEKNAAVPVPERRRPLRTDEKLDSKLKKCKSSSSFLTQELMNQIVERVYGFQDPYAEDHGYDDYSTKVTMNSKLTTRKISTTKREANVPSIEEDSREDERRDDIALVDEKVEIITKEEAAPVERATAGHDEEITMDRRREIERALQGNVEHKKSKQETLSFIELEKLHAHPGHKRVAHTETTQAVSQPHIAEDIEKILSTTNPDEEAISHVLDDIYKTNSSILDEFQKYLNEGISDDQDSDGKPPTSDHVIVKKDGDHVGVKKIITTHTTTVGQPKTVTVAYEIENGNKKPLLVEVNGERRASIVDVDQWFLKHKEFTDHPRRGSESGIPAGYDTKKLFPFGKLDKGSSGATEFFDTKIQSRSVENIGGNHNESAVEHSTLLKFMK